ncbi:MAG: hypothetical protein QNK05_04250 [Myxococcota bacterium]|nr:hypothetical protein [Myxococcota bacterium]
MSEGLEAFFREYARACDSLEGERIAALCHCPCLMVNDEAVVPLQTEEAVLANMRALCAYHRENDYGRAIPEIVHAERPALSLAIVRVHWRVDRSDGSRLWEFDNTYHLVGGPADWRVLVSTTHASP